MYMNYALILILVAIIIYLTYIYSKLSAKYNLFKKASEALGISLFTASYPSKNYESFNNLGLVEINQDLLQTDNVLYVFQPKLCVKALLQNRQAYIGSLVLENLAHYKILDSLPFIAYIIDAEENVIFANKLYRPNLCFNAQEVKLGYGKRIIDGHWQYFELHVVTLDSQNKLLCAFDCTKQKMLEQDLYQIKKGYKQNLDFIPIAISIFDNNHNLIFANEAFLQLFGLEENFIQKLPSHNAILEKLRSLDKLPIVSNWHEWRRELFKVYLKVEPQQDKWFLPDGRTLRVIAHPQPQGGVCWIYENLTPLLEVQLRYNNLIARQGDILDNLLEGIALFASNGKIILSNPAFTNLWGVGPEAAIEGTHINILVQNFISLIKSQSLAELNELPGYIAGISTSRTLKKGQLELKTGAILEYILSPMLSGQIMLIFADITAKMFVLKNLEQQNEALLLSDKLRNGFVRNISYDLLTPLTTIDGFTQLMLANKNLAIDARTKSYLQDIASESQRLNNMIQDMIDLASLNAGIMQLTIEQFNLKNLISEIYTDVETILLANNIGFKVNSKLDDHNFYGDKKRLKQLIVNILSYYALHTIHNDAIIFEITKDNKQLTLKFMAPIVLHEEKGQIALPLARSICNLWGGSFELNADKIICCLSALKS